MRVLLLGIVALAASFISLPPVEAQSPPPPSGSWRESCVEGRWVGSVFQARCQRMNGRVLLSRVDMRGYGGWVANCDGRLTRAVYCRARSLQSSFPRGSWRETCADPVWYGRVIRASCQSMQGDWRAASFDTNSAFFGLSNCDGELVGSVACGDRAEDGFPSGNWSSYCRDATVIDGSCGLAVSITVSGGHGH